MWTKGCVQIRAVVPRLPFKAKGLGLIPGAGHWIQDCPNNDDPQAQEKKRYVRVTGIPRSMLKTVETPVGNEGSSAGAMLTADGGFVQAMPDT